MRNFTEQEIVETYYRHVRKDDSYYTKYERLPLELNNKGWRWEGKDFPRVWCVLDFREWLLKHNIGHFESVLSTCEQPELYPDPELEYITYDSIDYAAYNHGKNDLHTLDLPRKDYDFFIFNQTLEHLHNPFLAMQRIYEHVRPGGYLFTSVPTINIPHMVPFHFNGFTPMGLAMLMKSAGFEVVEVGFWGNTDYISSIFRTGNWPDYRELWSDGVVRNERDKEAQCWTLVRKPF